MGIKERYEKSKAKLLVDVSVCVENRQLFTEFFGYEEYKLKRQNNLPTLDEACHKTLLKYTYLLRRVNGWFGNKSWKDLTRNDIKQVYDDLEEGRLRSKRGGPYKDRAGLYNKILKSKPFALAGKAELAKEVIEFHCRDPDKHVRFVTEESFKKLEGVVTKPTHKLLLWLAWDVGENIGALLQLTKRDFTRQLNPDTKEPEYLVNFPKAKIKRSRKSRSEPTLYPETVRYAEIVLADKEADDLLFPFGYRRSKQIIQACVKKTGAMCMPHNDALTWKDLRSGMACHLLKSGWSRDEVNARLGHTPSSSELNSYINYLAIDRHRPKQKLQTTRLEDIQNELEETRRREKLAGERMRRQAEENETLKKELSGTQRDVQELRRQMEQALSLIQKKAC